MRKILAALVCLIALSVPAYAQKSGAALATEINANWPNNTSGLITPALLRSVVLDIVNSILTQNGCPSEVAGFQSDGVTPKCYSAFSGALGSISVMVRSSSAAVVSPSATTDYFLCLDPTSNAITVDLPASPTTGLTFLVKDCTGQASVHAITVDAASGNVDGASSQSLSTNYQSEGFTYTGSQWSGN